MKLRIRNIVKKLSKIQKLLLILSFLFFIATSFFIYNNYQITKAKPALEKTVNEFLIYVSDQDYVRAYDMVSDEIKTTIDFKTFKKLFTNLRAMYADYKPNSLHTTNITRHYNPLATAHLTYNGIMTYQDNTTEYETHNDGEEKATVEATFTWKNNRWELAGVYVYAPSSRLEKYSLPNKK